MSNKDKAKVLLFVVSMIGLIAMSAYSGYKYPELYIIPIEGHYITPYMEGVAQINITNYCPPDPRVFVAFIDNYWCVA